ncbi:MAG: PqqD family protein [Spirochaetes bacterium]|nr:PqqD family protein [Spirochaetota bacterium]
MDLNFTPFIVEGLCVRELGDSIIIITEKGDLLHNLDEIGGLIWKFIDGSRSALAILEKICEEYDVERSRAEGDLIEFLTTLKDKNLVRF